MLTGSKDFEDIMANDANHKMDRQPRNTSVTRVCTAATSSFASRSTHYVPDAPRLASLKRLTRRLAQVAVPALFLSLAACGGNMEEPKVQLNPTNSNDISVLVRTANTPGIFDNILAFAQFRVTNPECVPKQPVSGARLIPHKRLPIELIKKDDATYSGQFAVSPFLDEDYFGHGVCHWQLVSIEASAKKGRTTFSVDMYTQWKSPHDELVKYFSKSGYDAAPDDFIDTGSTDKERIKDPSTAFSLALSLEEFRP